MSEKQLFYKRLQSLRSRYYKVEFLRSVSWFLFISVLMFFTLSLTNYLFRIEELYRQIIFWSYIGGELVLAWFTFGRVLVNWAGYNGLSSREVAQLLIGSDVRDVALNIIDLDSEDSELIEAAINQKALSVRNFDFKRVYNFKRSFGALYFLLGCLFVIVPISLVNSNIIDVGSKQFVFYDTEVERPAPFEYEFVSSNVAESGTDYRVLIKLKEDSQREGLFVTVNGRKLPLKYQQGTYMYDLYNVQSNLKMAIEYGDWSSSSYDVTVQHRPEIVDFSYKVDYPKYLNRASQRFNGFSNRSFPEGSRVSFSYDFNYVDNYVLQLNNADTVINVLTVIEPTEVRFQLSNEYFKSESTGKLFIDVVKDEKPQLKVERTIDSIHSNLAELFVETEDDYGLSNVQLVIEINGKIFRENLEGVSGRFFRKNLELNFANYNLKEGEDLIYFVRSVDNNAVSGRGVTESIHYRYSKKSKEELNEELDEAHKSMQESLNTQQNKLERIHSKLENIQNSGMKNKTWKEKTQIEKALEERKEVQEELEKLKQELEELKESSELDSLMKEDLIKKQEELDQLLEEILDDELMDLLEELQELLKQDDQKFEEKMDEFLQKDEKNKDNWDRTQELLKRLSLEKKWDDLSNELEELAKEQKELSEETKEEGISEDLKKEQEKIDSAFKELMKEKDSLMKDNEGLKSPFKLDEQKEKENSVNESLENSKESLDQGKEKKSSESQNDASQKMQEMSQQMQSDMASSNAEQNKEDIDNLKQIVSNLIVLSKEIEDLGIYYSDATANDLLLPESNKKFIGLTKDSKMVEDSLVALGSRNFQIATFISDELNDLNSEMNKVIGGISESQWKDVSFRQQRMMMRYNNLALMLEESLDQMQQEMQSSGKPGSGSCNKPGGQGQQDGESEMNMQQLKDMLKEQIGKMKGPKPGQGQQGESGMPIPMPGGKDLVDMIQGNEKLQKELKKMKEQMNQDGSGRGNSLDDIIELLEENKKDLIDQNWSPELYRRQQEIYTRLLESEKAERERGESEERESNEGKNIENRNPFEILEYNKEKSQNKELLNTESLDLLRFYDELSKSYMIQSL